MTQPIDIIKGSMRAIGALAAGENPTADEGQDGLDLLNEFLEYCSNQKQLVFCIQEAIHELTAGQFTYTVGSTASNLACTFTGSIAGTVLTVTAIASGALSVGQILTGTGITTGTAITSYGTGRGGASTAALGTYNLQLSNTFASATIVSYVPRPLRINSAFVRVVSSIGGTLDYPIAVITDEEYELIGLKALNGPWPRALYYQPSMPLGVLNYWPNPSQGEMHLFCDTILNQFATLQDTVTFPPGYKIFLRYNFAEFLLTEYPRTDPQIAAQVREMADKTRASLKRTNMQPQQAVRFDELLVAGKRKDAGWILSGGFH